MNTARPSPPPSPPLSSGLTGREQLIAAARELGEQVWAHSLRTPAGRVTWVGPTGYGTEENPLRRVQLGFNLYDGTGGIALFLAALARVTREERFRQMALEAMAPLHANLRSLVSEPARAEALEMSVGGMMGLCSYLYGLLRVGTLLDEPALIDMAHMASSLVTPERIARDMRPRVQTGCAGAILVLLALHQARPQRNARGQTPLELAMECARQVQAHRLSFEGRPRAWPLSPKKPPLGDFCYGAAGISYALLRLYEQTRQDEVWAVAQEGLAFVRGLYSPEHGNWRDIRATIEARVQKREGSTWRDFWFNDWSDKAEAPLGGEDITQPRALVDSFSHSWCHGGTGIVLGRLAALHLVDSPEVREEIAAALATVCACAEPQRFAQVQEDDLCCGHMGRVDVLLQASLMPGHELLRATAESLASQVWLRARERGRYTLSAARGHETFAPTLFQGAAGVGYGFLRLALPEQLPCVLLLE